MKRKLSGYDKLDGELYNALCSGTATPEQQRTAAFSLLEHYPKLREIFRKAVEYRKVVASISPTKSAGQKF